MNLRWVHAAAFWAVILIWLVFAATFLLHKKPSGGKAQKASRVSIVGIVIQGLGFTLVWMLERTRFTPIVPLPGLLQTIPALFAVGLALFSRWLAMASIRTLGKEWSLEARLVEGHRLVTAGPYGVIRHPNYTSMLCMLIATGLVISHWIGLVAGAVMFSIGTGIRVRSEERLLREQFGEEFEAYTRRVGAVLPRWGGS